MTSPTVVATANVHWRLRADPARQALEGVLAQGPDLVGLQEWGLSRRRILPRGTSGYVWWAPYVGGCPVGARADRFELTGRRQVVLSRAGRDGRPEHRLGLRRARLATVATYRDRDGDRPVSVVCFHLTPGVQASGEYRGDRPGPVARHRQEVRRLQDVVDALLGAGHAVHALGDSNFDGLRLRGLTSAWDGRDDEPGTLGPLRRVDDVHSAPGRAVSVTRVASDSDHQGVVVTVASDAPGPRSSA